MQALIPLPSLEWSGVSDCLRFPGKRKDTRALYERLRDFERHLATIFMFRLPWQAWLLFAKVYQHEALEETARKTGTNLRNESKRIISFNWFVMSLQLTDAEISH